MRRQSMLPFLQTFGSVHRHVEEREFADASRRDAELTREAIATAQASGVFGNGRLANLADARAAHLLDRNGLFLGALNKRLLFYSGDAPLLTYARTGTGKGRDFILTNLAHSRDRSLVVTDTKDGENCFASHNHRSKTLGHPCIYLNPCGLLGLADTRINPLQTLIGIVQSGRQIDSEADEIAHILVPPSVKDQNGDWVGKGARRLLSTRMEYLAHFEPELCTLGGVWRFVNSSLGRYGHGFRHDGDVRCRWHTRSGRSASRDGGQGAEAI